MLISGLQVSSDVLMGDQEDFFIYFDTLFGFGVLFLLTSVALGFGSSYR